jgi:hypothetical protein
MLRQPYLDVRIAFCWLVREASLCDNSTKLHDRALVRLGAKLLLVISTEVLVQIVIIATHGPERTLNSVREDWK